jgi:hypothetical protein
MDWRLSNHFFAAGFELGIDAFRLEPLEDLSVGTLGLAIAPGIGNGGEVDLDVGQCAVLPEQPASELAAFVGDYAVRHTKMADQAMDELDCRPGRNGAHRIHLYPLGKLVDGDIEVEISPLRSREWTQDVQPPNSKGPSERDGLQLLCWLMYLLGVELARLAPLDHLCSIPEHRRPVEAATICLRGEG